MMHFLKSISLTFFYILFLTRFFLLANICEDPGKDRFPDIHKISNGMYMGKMCSKSLFAREDLYLVMERLDKTNLTCWKEYMGMQVRRQKRYRSSTGAKVYTGTGSEEALRVINDGLHAPEEKWMAYITYEATPIKIVDATASWENYLGSGHSQQKEYIEFAKKIVMFTTVTASPEALIGTPMGIARAVDARHEVHSPFRPKYISIDLLSFIAKVLLMRNPERKFMINAPEQGMAKIIVYNLPANTVFEGTKEGRDYFYQFPKRCPPILSLDSDTPYASLSSYLIIYDKEDRTKEWLKIDKGDCNYDWIFRGLADATLCPLIAVDLQALANCRTTEKFVPKEPPEILTPLEVLKEEVSTPIAKTTPEKYYTVCKRIETFLKELSHF